MPPRYLFILLIAVVSSVAFAQPPARPTSSRPPASKPSPVLAILNGQPITLADVDPKVRDLANGFDKQVAELRTALLNSRINRIAMDAEAKKRKLSVEDMLQTEVADRVIGPTDQDIRVFYDANKSKMNGASIDQVRSQIIDYLRDERGAKLAEAFIKRLRVAHQLTLGIDVNSPNLTPTSVMATIGGTRINYADFSEWFKPHYHKLQMQLYEAEIGATDARINQTLVTAEARKRGLTIEALRTAEVTKKAKTPTDADIAKFYDENAARLNGDLPSLRESIRQFLVEEGLLRAEDAFVKILRAAAKIEMRLKEPEAPSQKISVDDDPSRGPANAPVVVVVFTDFQCPSCAAMHPIIDEVTKRFPNDVRLVIRDYPLDRHPNARKAAEAANAAHAQGRFFDYFPELYKNQSALDTISLQQYATRIGLDRVRFDQELESGRYTAEVSHDLADGELYGIDSTPAIFVNGVKLGDYTAEGLRTLIERELAKAKQSPRRPS